MKAVITGAGGFIGAKLARAILEHGTLVGPTGAPETVDDLVLFDTEFSNPVQDPRIRIVVGDVADPDAVAVAVDDDTASVFHLAAVVSAGAEEDFDLGYRVNLEGTRTVLERCRTLRHPPRFVFASSIAVYGGALPDVIVDSTPTWPQTSYGAQKLIAEAFIRDYSRKGFIDGRSLRLPTVMVRLGKPNRAASTWASSIIREPLSGVDFACPVKRDVRMACLSARRTVEAFIHMHDLPADRLGVERCALLTGISVSAGEMADAVKRNRGNRKIGKISWREDPTIQRIVGAWPKETRSEKAGALGFEHDQNIDEIVRAFIADDLDAQIESMRR